MAFLIFTNDSGIVANRFGSGNLYFFNAVVSSCDIRCFICLFIDIVLLLDMLVSINFFESVGRNVQVGGACSVC